jgi:pentapeptide MXKDX repeat protein
MKRNFLVISLLLSILFWGINTTAFAQDQVIKDKKVQEVKKDVMKKGDVKKQEMIKKGEMKKGEMMKKGEVKKDVMKKELTSKKEVKEVKTVIKDKEVGKTADGKVIYEGSRGGKYTLSATGKKVYIKKGEK